MTSNPNKREPGRSKAVKLTGPEEVTRFLNVLEHPLNGEIEAVRRLILSVDEGITEHIKWNAPSFCYNQGDRVI